MGEKKEFTKAEAEAMATAAGKRAYAEAQETANAAVAGAYNDGYTRAVLDLQDSDQQTPTPPPKEITEVLSVGVTVSYNGADGPVEFLRIYGRYCDLWLYEDGLKTLRRILLLGLP